jgi:hypothetical protein
MREAVFILCMSGILCSCTTLNRSLQFGSIAGSVVGATATYVSQNSVGANPTLENVGIGASIGMALGLISSYFIHSSIVEERVDQIRETQIYFGDLPPSPFLIPTKSKKGGH